MNVHSLNMVRQLHDNGKLPLSVACEFLRYGVIAHKIDSLKDVQDKKKQIVMCYLVLKSQVPPTSCKLSEILRGVVSEQAKLKEFYDQIDVYMEA